MLKLCRHFLTFILCALSMVSSAGSAEVLHETLHSLAASACVDAAETAHRDSGAHVERLVSQCPVQVILQSSLAQAIVLPTAPVPTLALPIFYKALLAFESAGISSLGASWTFARGPPIFA